MLQSNYSTYTRQTSNSHKVKSNYVEVLNLLLPSTETTHSTVTRHHLFHWDLERTDMKLWPNIYTYNSYKISGVPGGLSIISHVNNHQQKNFKYGCNVFSQNFTVITVKQSLVFSVF